MVGLRKSLLWLVVAVLVLAGGTFALRSWVGTEPADDRVAPGTVAQTVTPSPSATPTPTPTPTPTSTPTPSATPTPPRATLVTPTRAPRSALPRATRSTAAVTAEIKASLDARGRPTSVACPGVVPATVGVTFSCTVAYADSPSVVIADASVRITSARGTFVWRSVSRS